MPLAQLLLLLLLAVPIIEIYLLVKVGGLIGALPTIGLVILTAVTGALLLRHQGLATLRRVQSALARGELPTLAMLEGLVILVSGVLLLTPGFFTDALGLAGLLPPLRRRLIRSLLARGVATATHHRGAPRGPDSGPRTLEGEYRRDDE